MKKIITLFSLVLILFLIYKNSNVDEIEIPENSLRLRVIPNSNNAYDIEIKTLVKEYLEDNIYPLLQDTKTIEEAKTVINNNMNTINNNIESIFKENNYNESFTVDLGLNYFPDKKYKGVIYNQGMYDSLVVYIGEAKGDNWWCVLFPPLCLLEADDSEANDVEYTFFVKEIINKFKNI